MVLNKADTAFDAGKNIRPVLNPSSKSVSILTPSITDSKPKAVALSKSPPPFFVIPAASFVFKKSLIFVDVILVAFPPFKP